MSNKYRHEFRNNKEINKYNSKAMAIFRDKHKDDVKRVPTTSIYITEPIHNGFLTDSVYREIERYRKERLIMNDILIVYPLVNQTYKLISGWKSYHIARGIRQNSVKVIILRSCSSRSVLLDVIGGVKEYSVVKMDDLLVQGRYDRTIVNPEKLWEIKEYDMENHAQAKPITVTNEKIIVDGYAQYVYNRNMGYEYCEVAYIEEDHDND